MIVDVVQAWIAAGIVGVYAPLNGEFPSTNLSGQLPLATTWEGPNSVDPSGSLMSAIMNTRVFVETVGARNWPEIKDECEALHDSFVTLFNVRGDDTFIQNGPPVRIDPESVNVGGYYDVIEAPDGERFHGFEVNYEATVHIDVAAGTCPE